VPEPRRWCAQTPLMGTGLYKPGIKKKADQIVNFQVHILLTKKFRFSFVKTEPVLNTGVKLRVGENACVRSLRIRRHSVLPRTARIGHNAQLSHIRSFDAKRGIRLNAW
jgi:hypothetical protein